tara:strand:- start:8679 stop:9176 length:498 start_codon:yes stop_codon:yes gene_type:complete
MASKAEEKYGVEFGEWYALHENEYDEFWSTERTEMENAYKQWKSLNKTYQPMIDDLQDQYDDLTALTTSAHYRPEIGFQIQAGANKAESMWSGSTRKLFNTKAGSTMIASSGIASTMKDIETSFNSIMDNTIYSTYSDVQNKISGAKDLQRQIQSDIRGYERELV